MTIIETFMERHASLAEASVIDRSDLRDLIEEERGLTCELRVMRDSSIQTYNESNSRPRPVKYPC